MEIDSSIFLVQETTVIASLLLVATPFVTSSDALLLVASSCPRIVLEINPKRYSFSSSPCLIPAGRDCKDEQDSRHVARWSGQTRIV